MQAIVQEGAGIILYLRQEGRGIGLGNKLKAYSLQDKGADTVEANLCLGFAADQRDFMVAARMLQTLGVKALRLMTNNPQKVASLEQAGLVVSERIAHASPVDEYSAGYLKTKRDKLGHLL
jgi:GTP cyclohydrolase II